MDYETIEYAPAEEGIGILSLNRPRMYNSVSYQMMEELEDFWAQRREDLDTHVIILQGKGLLRRAGYEGTRQNQPRNDHR